MNARHIFSWNIMCVSLLLSLFFAVCQGAAFTLPDPVEKNFTDNQDGTVSCSDTSLMWEVKGGPETFNDASKTYDRTQAVSFIAQLNTMNYAGHNDWRLPTINELGYIVNYSIGTPGPVIDSQFFPRCQAGQYWSKTPYAANSNMAWYFCFSDASRKYSGTTDRFYVRAVREVN